MFRSMARQWTALAVLALMAGVCLPSQTLFAQPRPTAQPPPSYLWIGMAFEAEKDHGLLVIGITANSPAQKAGLQLGEFITAINGTDTKGFTNANDGWALLRANQANINFDLTVDRAGKTRTAKLVTALMAPDCAQTLEWLQKTFSPLLQTYQRSRSSGAPTAEVMKNHGAVAKACADPKISPKIKAGFAKPDEFYWDWIVCMGFLGKAERKNLEKFWFELMTPKLKPNEKPLSRILTKFRVCWALTAMSDPDTEVKTVKSILSAPDTPEFQQQGAELITAIFEELSLNQKKNARKMSQLADAYVAADLLPLLGNPCLDTHLNDYCKMLDQWEKAGKPNPATLNAQDAQAVQTSLFWVGRAESLTRAIGWMPARLAISYLVRIRENAPRLGKVADEGLERLFPGHKDISFAWYRDNSQFMFFDEDNGVWKFSEEAKAAGKPYEQWVKEKK